MPTFTAPDGTPYSSAGMPISTRIVTIKRGDGSTAGGGGSPTTIGTYLLENFSVVKSANEIRRRGISGEATDLALSRNAMTFSAKAQRATTSTKHPEGGDYFEEVLDGDTGTTRFVITSSTKEEGQPHSYNLSGVEDIENSAKYTA